MPQPLNLPPFERRLFEAAQQGISAEELRRQVQADGGGDRKHLHLCIAQLNTLLRPHGISIRSEGGIYRTRSTS
jgi:hypothetical protein